MSFELRHLGEKLFEALGRNPDNVNDVTISGNNMVIFFYKDGDIASVEFNIWEALALLEDNR